MTYRNGETFYGEHEIEGQGGSYRTTRSEFTERNPVLVIADPVALARDVVALAEALNKVAEHLQVALPRIEGDDGQEG